jgi:hypothetical protein
MRLGKRKKDHMAIVRYRSYALRVTQAPPFATSRHSSSSVLFLVDRFAQYLRLCSITHRASSPTRPGQPNKDTAALTRCIHLPRYLWIRKHELHTKDLLQESLTRSCTKLHLQFRDARQRITSGSTFGQGCQKPLRLIGLTSLTHVRPLLVVF